MTSTYAFVEREKRLNLANEETEALLNAFVQKEKRDSKSRMSVPLFFSGESAKIELMRATLNNRDQFDADVFSILGEKRGKAFLRLHRIPFDKVEQ